MERWTEGLGFGGGGGGGKGLNGGCWWLLSGKERKLGKSKERWREEENGRGEFHVAGKKKKE